MSGPRGCFFVPTRAVRFLRAVTGSGHLRVKGRAVSLRRRFVRDAGWRLRPSRASRRRQPPACSRQWEKVGEIIDNASMEAV